MGDVFLRAFVVRWERVGIRREEKRKKSFYTADRSNLDASRQTSPFRELLRDDLKGPWFSSQRSRLPLGGS